jgi:hypothetical protein
MNSDTSALLPQLCNLLDAVNDTALFFLRFKLSFRWNEPTEWMRSRLPFFKTSSSRTSAKDANTELMLLVDMLHL